MTNMVAESPDDLFHSLLAFPQVAIRRVHTELCQNCPLLGEISLKRGLPSDSLLCGQSFVNQIKEMRWVRVRLWCKRKIGCEGMADAIGHQKSHRMNVGRNNLRAKTSQAHVVSYHIANRSYSEANQ